MEIQGLFDIGGRTKLQVARRIYRLFSIGRDVELANDGKLRGSSFARRFTGVEGPHILQILGAHCAPHRSDSAAVARHYAQDHRSQPSWRNRYLNPSLLTTYGILVTSPP